MGATAQKPAEYTHVPTTTTPQPYPAQPTTATRQPYPAQPTTATPQPYPAQPNAAYIGTSKEGQLYQPPTDDARGRVYNPSGGGLNNPPGGIYDNNKMLTSTNSLQEASPGDTTVAPQAPTDPAQAPALQKATADQLRQMPWQSRKTQNQAAPAAAAGPTPADAPPLADTAPAATPPGQSGGMEGKISQAPPQFQQGLTQMMGKMSQPPPGQPQNARGRPAGMGQPVPQNAAGPVPATPEGDALRQKPQRPGSEPFVPDPIRAADRAAKLAARRVKKAGAATVSASENRDGATETVNADGSVTTKRPGIPGSTTQTKAEYDAAQKRRSTGR